MLSIDVLSKSFVFVSSSSITGGSKSSSSTSEDFSRFAEENSYLDIDNYKNMLDSFKLYDISKNNLITITNNNSTITIATTYLINNQKETHFIWKGEEYKSLLKYERDVDLETAIGKITELKVGDIKVDENEHYFKVVIEDFSKYVSFHLSAWPPKNDDDNGPIKRNSLREMQTPQFPRLYPNARDYNGDTCALMNGYGFGLGIATFCNDIKRVSHGGALPGFGSNYYFYPEYGVGVMAFGNLTYTGPLPISKIEQLLFDKAIIQPRELPVSNILEKRKEQVLDLVKNWNTNLEKEIIAENFYLDRSREKRMSQAKQI